MKREIIIVIGIKNGKLKSKLQNIEANVDDVAKSIAILKLFTERQVKLFEIFNEEGKIN